jgi:hypothetical protein
MNSPTATARDEWKPFGSHIDQQGVKLEFRGEDAAGLPLQERPALKEPSSYQISILVGLNKLGKHVFSGLVSRHSKESPRATRRRKARVVKASRRANRG